MLIIICFTTSVGAFKLPHPHQQPHPPLPARSHQRNSLDQALVDPHLKGIPRLTPLPTRRLPGRDLQDLGRQTHGALDAEVLGLGPLDQLLAHFLQRLHFARRERDADLVDFLVGRVGVSLVMVGSGEEGARTGPSPRSFSGLLYDIFGGLRWG